LPSTGLPSSDPCAPSRASGKSGAVHSLLPLAIQDSAEALSIEDSNGCATTQDDPCVRTGSCEIQRATWPQVVTVDRSDIFDTQGWAGVCDMVHVALVQGNCEPPGAKIDVVAFLSETSFAAIPEIVGPLSCAGEPEPEPPAVPALGLVGGSALALMIASLGWTARRRATSRCTARAENSASSTQTPPMAGKMPGRTRSQRVSGGRDARGARSRARVPFQ